MGGHNDGASILIDVLKNLHDLNAGLWIKVSRWLIGKNKFRVVQKGTGNGNTLLFPARKFMRIFKTFGLHAHFVQNLFYFGIHL